MQNQKNQTPATVPVTLHRWEDIQEFFRSILQLHTFKNEGNHYIAALYLTNRFELIKYDATIVSELLHVNHYYRQLAETALECKADRMMIAYYTPMADFMQPEYMDYEQQDWLMEYEAVYDALKRMFYPLKIQLCSYMVFDKQLKNQVIENPLPKVRF